MAPTLRASLLALLLAGSLVPLAGLAIFEARVVGEERAARQSADLQAAALAAAVRAEDALARGADPLAAAREGAPGEVMLVSRDGAQWPAFRAQTGERLSGVAHLAHPTDGREVVVAWGRAPGADADVAVLVAPSASSAAMLAPFVLLGGFLAGSLVIILAFVATRILRPVTRLEKASRRIARGEWSERVPVEGPREVRALANAFNEMAAALDRQRQHLDALLEERTRALIDREGDLDALRFTLAHEFREPMRSLRWMADDLLERPLAPDTREAVSVLRRRIADIDAVFRDLLRYEDVSRRPAPREPVDLERTLDAALAVAADTAPLDVRGVRLPDIDGNADLLQIAFTEVLRNAAQHARGRDGVARVALRVDGTSDELVVHIDDEGPGIHSARRADALHLFQRLRRDVPGTGAGLAIARRALERQGGSLELGDSPEGGLRATMRLSRGGERVRTAAERPARRF